MLPAGKPPTFRAMRRTASFANGIQVGLGAPCPCSELNVILPVTRLRLGKVLIELSSDCMTNAMTVCSDQCLKS